MGSLELVLGYLGRFKYVAMFGILFLCGLGLPIPEEATLIGSGLLVGWGDADFTYSSVACVLGISAGDSVVFGLGYFFGQRFLNSRPMRFLLPARRQKKVDRFFAKHGKKAVFFARFFAGVRMGVYAYAGAQRMNWFRFLFLDFLGAMISGPTSIWLGKWAATKFAENKEEAAAKAYELVHEAFPWLVFGLVIVVSLYTLVVFVRGKRRRAARSRTARHEVAPQPGREDEKTPPERPEKVVSPAVERHKAQPP